MLVAYRLGCSLFYEQSLIGIILPPKKSLVRTVSLGGNIPKYRVLKALRGVLFQRVACESALSMLSKVQGGGGEP